MTFQFARTVLHLVYCTLLLLGHCQFGHQTVTQVDFYNETNRRPCWCDPDNFQHQRTTFQIAHFLENGTLKFVNTDQLVNLMRSHVLVGDRKVALVSIVGAYRSGKSTLLNIIHRYLACTTNNRQSISSAVLPTSSWLYEHSEKGPKANSSSKLFETSSQQAVCTKGIWITSVPYVTKQNTSVFLLDTQGLFDNKRNGSKTDSNLLYFISLLSSKMIVNTKQHLDRPLTNLIGTLTLRIRQTMQNTLDTKNGDITGKLLQDIVFLVRDYHLQQKDANVYLANYFMDKLQGSLEEMQLGFDNISCFLLPAIALNPENLEITHARLNPAFAAQCKRFLHAHFLPSLIRPKTIFGKQISGNELAERIKKYVKMFEGNTFPSIADIYESELNLISEEISTDAVQTFKTRFDEGIRTFDINDIQNNIVRLHKNLQHQLVDQIRSHDLLKRKTDLLTKTISSFNLKTETFLDHSVQTFRTLQTEKELNEHKQKIKVLTEQREYEFQTYVQEKDSGFLQNLLKPIMPLIYVCLAVASLYIMYCIISCFNHLRVRNQVTAIP